jgi:hypothetical protein
MCVMIKSKFPEKFISKTPDLNQVNSLIFRFFIRACEGEKKTLENREK